MRRLCFMSFFQSRKTGDCMSDGSIYVGTSPTTSKPLYILPLDQTDIPHGEDACTTWYEACAHADRQARLSVLGHDDWRLPSKAELRLIDRYLVYRHMQCPGLTAHSYWSYKQHSYRGEAPLRAWALFFGYGLLDPLEKTKCGRVLCVRCA